MLHLTFKNIWARKRRLFGAGTAVILGVAFLFATLTIGDTLRAGYDTLFDEANAGIDVSVRSDVVLGSDNFRRRGTLSQNAQSSIEQVNGVAEVRPVIDGRAQIVGADGVDLGGNGPPTTATNWIDSEVNPFRLVAGRAPKAVPSADRVEVVIDRGSADDGGLAVGDMTNVKLPAPQEVTVVGIAAFGDEDSLGSSTWVAFETETARTLLLDEPRSGGDGSGMNEVQVSSFAVVTEPGADPSAVRASIATMLPDGAEALTGNELTAEQVAEVEGDFVGFVRLFLLAFAGVAVLVATFSIYNTFSILVAQRTRESALLRSIGASRRQVLTSTVVEAVTIGVVASIIGLFAGWGLGVGLRALLDATGIELPGSGVLVTTTAVGTALLCGIAVTLFASVVPAIRASGVAPLAALREAAFDRPGISVVRALTGSVLAVAGIVLAIAATRSDDGAFLRAGLGSLAAIVGTVVLGPVVARPVMSALGAPVRWARGETGHIAARNAMRNPRRTAATASGLLVGTSVVVVFTVLGSSVTRSIEQSVDRTFGGDLVIIQQSFSGAAIDPTLAGAIEGLDEVDVAAGMAFGPARIDGQAIEASAVDPARFASVLELDVTEGSVTGLTSGEFAMSVDEAVERGWSIGDDLPVEFVDGSSRTITLAALYTERDIADDIVLNIADVPRSAGFEGDLAVLVDLAPGVDVVAAAAAVDEVGAPGGAPDAQTRDQYMDGVVSEVQTLLGVVYGLLALAVLIAVMGIANTLTLSIHERTRELGLLRAVGQTRSQLRASVRWESFLIAVFGAIGGVGLGTFLGWALVRAVAAQEGLGAFTVPIGPLGVIVVVAALAGTLAAQRPARRAARLDVITALASD